MRRIEALTAIWLMVACQPKGGSDGDAKGDSTSETTATDSATDTATATQAGVVLLANDLSELKLSAALSFGAPPSVLGEGEAVSVDGSGNVAITTALTDPPKSAAACQVRRRVKAAMRSLRLIARDFCYIENDAGNLPFDKKYKIDHGGGESKSFWVTKKADRIAVSFCENDQLHYEFIVNGVKDGKATGSLRSVHTEAGVTHFVDGRFDNHMLMPDRLRALTRRLELYGDGTAENRSEVALSLRDDDVSVVASSLTQKYLHPDTAAFTTNYLVSFARVGPHLGQSVAYQSGDQDGDGLPDAQGVAFRSNFDSAGNSLKKDAAAQFKEAGILRVGAVHMPKPLDDDFTPQPFGADSWDCSEAETVAPLGTNDQYLACDALTGGLADEDCSVDAYTSDDDEAPAATPFATPGTEAAVF